MRPAPSLAAPTHTSQASVPPPPTHTAPGHEPWQTGIMRTQAHTSSRARCVVAIVAAAAACTLQSLAAVAKPCRKSQDAKNRSCRGSFLLFCHSSITRCCCVSRCGTATCHTPRELRRKQGVKWFCLIARSLLRATVPEPWRQSRRGVSSTPQRSFDLGGC